MSFSFLALIEANYTLDRPLLCQMSLFSLYHHVSKALGLSDQSWVRLLTALLFCKHLVQTTNIS